MFYCWVKSRAWLVYLVEISKQHVEGVAWILFTVDSKAQEERKKLRGGIVKLKGTNIWSFWSSTLIQIALIRKFTVERIHSRESTKGGARQHFAGEIKYVTNGNHWPSQQKPGIKVGLSRKYLENCHVKWRQSPWHTLETHKVCENAIPAETLPSWTERDRVWI